MQRLCLIVLVSFIGLGLSACGDDSPNKPEDPFEGIRKGDGGAGSTMFPGGMPGGLSGGVDPADVVGHAMNMGKIELTDEVMASYVEVLKDLKTKDIDTPGEALLTAHSLDWKRWAFVSATIARANMIGHLPDQVAAAEKALAQARQQAAQATDERMKAAFEAQTNGFEQQLKNLKAMPGPTDVDRKNLAVFERWKERIKAAGD